MNIETKFIGEVEINEQDILTFEEGILGFVEQTKYVLLPLDPDLPITLLQSTENPELGFIVAYPFAFKHDYAFDLTEQDKQDLKVTKEADALVYSIVTLKESFEESTLNLLAPIVVNINEKRGKQIVLQDGEQYPLRFAIKDFKENVK